MAVAYTDYEICQVFIILKDSLLSSTLGINLLMPNEAIFNCMMVGFGIILLLFYFICCGCFENNCKEKTERK